MEYFGCVPQEQFELLSEEEKIDFLLSKDIYQTIDEIELTLGEWTQIVPQNATEKNEPNKIVIKQLYDFVIERYAEFISQGFYSFQIDFNEKKYGLKKSKQRKLALAHFKDQYEHIASKNIALVRQRNLENGGIVIEYVPKLEFLKEQQRTLLSNLWKTELLEQFLFGNKDYFVASRLDEVTILNEVIDFEVAFSIMLSLNGQFHFENDVSFSNSSENTVDKESEEHPLITEKEVSEAPSTKDITKTEELKKIITKRAVLSDEEAVHYLIENVFSKK